MQPYTPLTQLTTFNPVDWDPADTGSLCHESANHICGIDTTCNIIGQSKIIQPVSSRLNLHAFQTLPNVLKPTNDETQRHRR